MERNRLNEKKMFKITGDHIKTGFRPQTTVIIGDTRMLITGEKIITGSFKKYFDYLILSINISE